MIETKGLAALSGEIVPQKLYESSSQPAIKPWVSPFSHANYYFDQKLNKNLNVHIGLIISAVGGSQIQHSGGLEAIFHQQQPS